MHKTNRNKPMSYTRVIPRDLFNEAKLLKCLGQLSLFHIDNRYPGLGVNYVPLQIDEHDHEEGFHVEQAGDGDIYCSEITVVVNDVEIEVFTGMNSREPYPLLFLADDGGQSPVFNDDGTLSPEFLELF